MSAETPTFDCVKIEREGPVTFVVLNRPEKRNAMSPQLHLDMCDALDWAQMDEQTRVVVVTGAGGNFCAGQDLKLYFTNGAGTSCPCSPSPPSPWSTVIASAEDSLPSSPVTSQSQLTTRPLVCLK